LSNNENFDFYVVDLPNDVINDDEAAHHSLEQDRLNQISNKKQLVSVMRIRKENIIF
jgi:hypothetical protein